MKFFEVLLAVMSGSYEEISGLLNKIAKGITSFWQLIFGKLSGAAAYIAYLVSAIGMITTFEFFFKGKITGMLVERNLNIDLAYLVSLPLFALLIYTAGRAYSTDKKKRLSGYILVGLIWIGWFGHGFYVNGKNAVNPLTGKGICITAENDKYKVVPCTWKSNNSNRNHVTEIPDQVLRAADITDGYIIPKKLPLSCNLRFHSIDGVTLIYYHLDDQNLLELSNLPIHHEKTNRIYQPVTQEIIDRICTSETETKTKNAETEAAVLQVENAALETENQRLWQQKKEDAAARSKAQPASASQTSSDSDLIVLVGGEHPVKYSDLYPGYVSEEPNTNQIQKLGALTNQHQNSATSSINQPTMPTAGATYYFIAMPSELKWTDNGYIEVLPVKNTRPLIFADHGKRFPVGTQIQIVEEKIRNQTMFSVEYMLPGDIMRPLTADMVFCVDTTGKPCTAP